MLEELLQFVNPVAFMPKAFEKCGLYPVNQEKVLERIPFVIQLHNVAGRLSKDLLLQKLDFRWIRERKKKAKGTESAFWPVTQQR